MTIAEVSKKYDLTADTIRYYERIGLIHTILNQNDLSGKNIKPFATNAGWIGRTFIEIKKLCPNSKVEDGLNILYDAGDYRTRKLITSLDEIDNWINTL